MKKPEEKEEHTGDQETRSLLIALNACSRITRAALCRLGGEPDLWRDANEASAELAAAAGVPRLQLERALIVRDDATRIAAEEESSARRRGCRIVTRFEEDYPSRLFDLALPPPLLLVRSGTPHMDSSVPAIALVGSRRTDSYGRTTARRFSQEFAAAGLTVVSGFARGIDAVSHAGAVQVPGGRTWAVLGCGIDIDYPKGQADLALQIAENGALLSEFALGAGPRPWRFPIRNRVIAALSDAVVVVQARRRSGSLITAHHAMELGRDVWAVPGRIGDELSQGTNDLIADGALVARDPEEIIESLLGPRQRGLFGLPEKSIRHMEDRIPAAVQPLSTAPPRPLPEGLAGRLLTLMEPGEGHTSEDLAARLDVGVDRILGVLLEMELSGWLRRDPGPIYIR